MQNDNKAVLSGGEDCKEGLISSGPHMVGIFGGEETVLYANCGDC